MAKFSVRIVDADYYLTYATTELDPNFSEFRQSQIHKVPVIRIFGSTPKGQKACLHIHNVFPYFYVPVPENVADSKKFSKQLALGLDSCINTSLGKAASQQQHYIHLIEVVQRIPFYGYYHECKDFYKIYMYNPRLVNRVSGILSNGTVLNTNFQPYETHIPYILQFFMDYNLHGMNLINLSNVKFRSPLPKGDLKGSINVSFKSPPRSPLGSPLYSQTNYDIFNDTTVPSWLVIDNLQKQTTCLLEVDAIAENIINQEYAKDNIGRNPGLNAIWDDEKLRRRQNNEDSVIEMPESQERTRYTTTELEKSNLQQLKVAIRDRLNRRNDVPLASSSQHSSDLSQEVGSQQQSLNQASDQLSSSIDNSLVDILVDMAEENSFNTPLSETTLINNGLEEDDNNTEDDEEVENLIMSQIIHDDPYTSPSHEEVEKTHDNSWSDTFISHIPQLDGQFDSDDSATTDEEGNYSRKQCKYCRENRVDAQNFDCKCLSGKRRVRSQVDDGSDSSSDDFQISQNKSRNNSKHACKSAFDISRNTFQLDSPSCSYKVHDKLLTRKYIDSHEKRKQEKYNMPSTNPNISVRKVYPKRTRSLPVYKFSKNSGCVDRRNIKVKHESSQCVNKRKYNLKQFKIILNDIMKERKKINSQKCEIGTKTKAITAGGYQNNFNYDSLSALSFNSPSKTNVKYSLQRMSLASPTAPDEQNMIICESPLDEIETTEASQYFDFEHFDKNEFGCTDFVSTHSKLKPQLENTVQNEKQSKTFSAFDEFQHIEIDNETGDTLPSPSANNAPFNPSASIASHEGLLSSNANHGELSLSNSDQGHPSTNKEHHESFSANNETLDTSDMSVDINSPLLIESCSPPSTQVHLDITETAITHNLHVHKKEKTPEVRTPDFPVILTPKTSPPSRHEANFLVGYDIPEKNYQGVYFSKESDTECASRVFHSDNIATVKTKVKQLPVYISNVTSSDSLTHFQRAQISEYDRSMSYNISEFNEIIYGDQPVIITPCQLPPKASSIQQELKAQTLHHKTHIEKKNLLQGRSKESEYSEDAWSDSRKKTSARNVKDSSKVKKKRISLFSPIKFISPSSCLNTSTKGTFIQSNSTMLLHSTPGASCKPSESLPFTSVVDNKKQTPAQSMESKQKLGKRLTFKPLEKMNISDIEGITPNNSYGFDLTQQNTKEAKALHVNQHLTIVSMELHVTTRRGLKPDPSIDPIAAIFYLIHDDSASSEKDKLGVFLVDDNSSRNLLSRTGMASFPCYCFKNEAEMLTNFALFIEEKDPDMILGYEVQMLSWGYLIERAGSLDINMITRLSRVREKEKGAPPPEISEKENWFGLLISMTIPGRIILNVWRVMRSEVTLQRYTFENVSYHVLHQRFPFYSFQHLSQWWLNNHQRWRVCDHYMTRCKGNHDMLEQIDFINRTSELARVFGISFYSVISRGTQFRVESMMLRTAKPLNYIPVSPSVHQRSKMASPECIPLVLEPESRFYVDPVIVLDFQSLYPSIIIAYNYCYSTCIGRVQSFSQSEEFKFGATSLKLPLNILKKLANGKIHISPNGVGFVTADVKRGILPRMLEEILNTRIMVKGAMKKAKEDKILYKMLDSRQLGLKLIANVTYGYTSANYSGRMPCIEIADSVVRKARETLEKAIHLVNSTKKWGAKVVYGDTDSLFVLLKGASKERAFIVAKEIIEEVTALNPKPVKLKFEKVYQPCVLITKKRYVGYMYETLDQKEPKMDAKGIETIRRDNCPAVGKIMEKSLKLLFETKDVSLVKSYVQTQFKKIIEGKVTMRDLTFAKEYRGMNHYAPGACVPALSIARKALKYDRRSEPRNGERVPYVIVHGSPGLPLIQLVRTPMEVIKNTSLRLNGLYYITKQICPSLNRIFSLVGVDVTQWYTELPRMTRVQEVNLHQPNNKKGTISQYFKSKHCPVCEQLTTKNLCTRCRDNPQQTVVVLSSRIMATDNRLTRLTQLCQHCSGSRNFDTGCESLDCPVFYKLCNVEAEEKRNENLRELLDELQW